MATIRLEAKYEPLPAQARFHQSRAVAKFYGGAMGGGKSKALCEEAFDAALAFPGIEILMARAEHTSIVDSTRKTMFREVIPPGLRQYCRIINSGGYDFITFPNGPTGTIDGGSTISFIGLNNPQKLHSTEYGLALIDEAHQVSEEDVMTINSRLRQKCRECLSESKTECNHLPHQLIFAANPENPGHFLYRWFIADAEKTEWGYYKPELRLEEDSEPLGAAEFIFANAHSNPYLPESYIRTRLASMTEFWRKRYLDGEWIHLSGLCVFDVAALTWYSEFSPLPRYRFDFLPTGMSDKARRKQSRTGRIRVYRDPEEDRQYALAADVATGHGADFSSAYVIDLHDMAFVAEFHDKIDADLFAEQLHFLGRWYNSALLAVESNTIGEAVIIALRDGKGGRPPYPRMYRHTLSSQVDMPLVKRYGYPINTKTREAVISQLGRAIREKTFPWMPSHLINECLTFCEFDEGTPAQRAQPGCHDDAVFSAAIVVELYRQKGLHPEREARVAKRFKQRFSKPKRREAVRGLDLSPWK